MKKKSIHIAQTPKMLWVSIITAMLMMTFMGGCSILDGKTEEPQTASPSPSANMESSPYTGLNYGGIDTNPQQVFNFYDVVDDSAFVADIWEELDYASWTQRETGSTAEVSIHLEFSGTDYPLSLEIDPNDVGWCHKSEGEGGRAIDVNYYLPKGTYERTSTLLMDYTAEHFMLKITPQLLDINVDSAVALSFSRGEIYFSVAPSITGNFTSEWQLDAWSETPLVNMESDYIRIGNVYCKDSSGPFNILIATDKSIIAIDYNGTSSAYKVPSEVIQTVLRQFEEFHQISPAQ